MGHHYVPQYYLRGFAAPQGEMLWAYDRSQHRKFFAPVKRVAQAPKYYSPALEKQFADQIETPANAVLDKLRRGDSFSASDKAVLAAYLVTLWKRVPKGFDRFKASLPGVAAEIGASVRQRIDFIATENPDIADLARRRKQEVDELLQGYLDKPPRDIRYGAISPTMATDAAMKAASMTWQLFHHTGKDIFLTSDNPVFFFSGIGIANPTSELSLPISSEICLWATNRKDLRDGYRRASLTIVKEFNRRTVQNSSRFVFAQRDDAWIMPFVAKSAWRVTRIV